MVDYFGFFVVEFAGDYRRVAGDFDDFVLVGVHVYVIGEGWEVVGDGFSGQVAYLAGFKSFAEVELVGDFWDELLESFEHFVVG